MEIISNTKPELNTVEVEFKIGAEGFESAVQAVFLKQRKNISVHGFRRGKATRKMLESQYGEGIFYEDAVNDLYRNNITGVIDELKLEIVDTPETEVSDLSKEAGVTFKVKFTVKPEVVVNGYKGVEVELEPINVTDEDVDKELQHILSENARIIDASDRPVQKGDLIKLDFTGFCDGEAFNGGTATDYELEVGSGRFIPGFEEQLVGKSVEEDFDVNVTFPADYPSEGVRGKEATFKCTIREISAKEVSELDDEFVKDISEFDTLDELKEDVRKGLTERNQEVRDLDLEREVAEKVADLTEVEVPQVMYEDRIDDMAREWANKHQMPVEEFAKYTGKTTEEYREDFREIAEKQVRFRLALDKIAEIEELQVSDEELEEEFEKIAKENRMTVEKVRSIAPEAGVRADLKAAKAMDLIKETAIIKDKAKQEQSDQGLIDDKTGIEIEAEFKEA